MRYSDIKNFDIANGNGIGVSVWVSGCIFHCKDCFNEAAWNFNAGKPWTEDTIEQIIKLCKNPNINHLSILGGEPLHPANMGGVYNLVSRFRAEFGTTKKIWLWTGYKVEDLSSGQKEVVKLLDYLVDGQYISELRDTNIRFRGSSNQRIWTWDNNNLVDISKDIDAII